VGVSWFGRQVGVVSPVFAVGPSKDQRAVSGVEVFLWIYVDVN